MFLSRLYRYFSLIMIIFLWADLSLAQKNSKAFEAAVTTIKKNIQCCSVAFSGNKSNKVTTVLISKNGEITIVYSHNRPPVSFNLFELYKHTKALQGIYYKQGSKIIVFNIEEFHAEVIRFNTASKANNTYKQFLSIIQSGK